MDRLRHALKRLHRESDLVAVLYLDLDQFKVVNDSLGPRLGDQVLMMMAQRLAAHLRPNDTLARLGGDEFVIVAEDVHSEQEAGELAARIVEAGREPFVIGEEQFVCTMSVGIACTADPGRSPEDMLREADLAMYKAKEHGRDRAEPFDDELREMAVSRLATERMVRAAVDEGRIRVEFQPIVQLASGAVVGAEALVRIEDPTCGIVPASSFIERAEETGLLVGIDARVLEESVRQAEGWRSRLQGSSLAGVSVNVTARHLGDPTFARAVIGSLDEHGIPHGFLRLEITERVLMEATGSALASLRTLRDAGVLVGLDDFGRGYSSLAYLLQFPLDFVKIDQQFVHYLDGGRTDRAIVSSVISLAHAIDLSVVAEGVETEEQRDLLTELECDEAQGFLFAPSVPASEVEALARSGV